MSLDVSPDGKTIAFDLLGDIYTMPIGTAQRILGGMSFDSQPKFSPDGKRLVFSSLNHLWLMDLPSGKPQRLTSLALGEFMPAWSPDGTFVAFVTWSKDGGQLYRIAAVPGSQPEKLSRYAAYYSEPAYTPDGSKIVYLTGTRTDQLYADLPYIQNGGDADVMPEEGTPGEISGIRPDAQMDLRWIPATGGESTLIGSSQGGHSPHFANDSMHIYLTTARGLSSVRIDGFDRRQIVQITGVGAGPNPPGASEIRWTPSGRRRRSSTDSTGGAAIPPCACRS